MLQGDQQALIELKAKWLRIHGIATDIQIEEWERAKQGGCHVTDGVGCFYKARWAYCWPCEARARLEEIRAARSKK